MKTIYTLLLFLISFSPVIAQKFTWDTFVNLLTAEETKQAQIEDLVNPEIKNLKIKGLHLASKSFREMKGSYQHNYYQLKLSKAFKKAVFFDLNIISNGEEIIFLQLIDKKRNRVILTRKMSRYDEFFKSIIQQFV